MDLVHLYLYPFVASLLVGPMLTQLGVELATRDRAMQMLCVSQGAVFGLLLGLGFWGEAERFSLSYLLIPLVGFMGAVFTYLFTLSLSQEKTASPNTLSAATFAVLTAASHLVVHLFPTLENHFAQIYMGDLATLTNADAKFLSVAGVFLGIYLWVFHRQISEQSFERAVFGKESRPSFDRIFECVSLLAITASIHSMGLLFTLSLLFLPTSLLRRADKSLFSHKISTQAVAFLGIASGFLISLLWTHLPTVPMIVGMVLCFGWINLKLKGALS